MASEALTRLRNERLSFPRSRIEVIPYGWSHTQERVAALGLQPALRRTEAGEPVTTDAGNYLLDCATHHITDPVSLGNAIKQLTGVVDHGLFCGLTTDGLIVDDSGQIIAINASSH